MVLLHNGIAHNASLDSMSVGIHHMNQSCACRAAQQLHLPFMMHARELAPSTSCGKLLLHASTEDYTGMLDQAAKGQQQHLHSMLL